MGRDRFNEVDFQRKKFLRLVGAERPKVLKALEFAQKSHANQKRRSGQPYIIHPIRVAAFLFEEGARTAPILCAALLHDTVEDCAVKPAQIRKMFGARVEFLVRKLTRDKAKISWHAKLEKTLGESGTVRLMKMADLLDNIHSMNYNKRGPWFRDFLGRLRLGAPLLAASLGDRYIDMTQAELEKLGQP